ncbi:MAG: DNA polymerase [Ignavibacteria bacterium]|nr:DNA polymerase [Ignavibacteria bacterium]
MNPLLYGHNPDEQIVGLQQNDDQTVRLFIRENGRLVRKDDPFFPFFFLSDRTLLEGFVQRHWIKELEGNGFYRFVCAFEGWPPLWEAVRHLLQAHNRKTLTKIEHYSSLESIRLLTDPLNQYLLQSGRTLFKGMRFEDLTRLQLDIETYTSVPNSFSRAARSGDRIILISLSDSGGWEHLIDGTELTEAEMLHELISIIRERDPDVLEGHNIYEFDLPYILKRCEHHGIPLTIGRDGSSPTAAFQRGRPSGIGTQGPVTEVAGRHVIDTYQLVRSYDQSKNRMERYGLKYAARYFGFASPERTYVRPERISWHWDHDREPLRLYAMDDVRETRALSGHLGGTHFYLTQMLPMTLSGVLRSGSAIKIENMLLREYLRRRYSIPRPSTGLQTTGGYTDIFTVGVLGPVLHADIESLYPSIMIHRSVTPAGDHLGIFKLLLQELTSQRLSAKQEMKREADPGARSRIDAFQSSMKILINSFYGYLGYARGLFNDYAKADVVTTEGQKLLRLMIDFIRKTGSIIIEVDTDGIFFVPPKAVRGEASEEEFVRTISDHMPEGISVALDGRYRTMMSYKMKNYALLDYEGNLTLKGSSFTSRSIERFGRAYIKRCVLALLNQDIQELHRAYMETREEIQGRRMDIREFTRVEKLGESIEEYLAAVDAGTRSRSAAYEVGLRIDRSFRKGTRIVYYMSGEDPTPKGFRHARAMADWDPHFRDENIPYYLRRLDEFSEKFSPFFSAKDFHMLFTPDDLFPFDPAGIRILEPTHLPVEEPEDTESPRYTGLKAEKES